MKREFTEQDLKNWGFTSTSFFYKDNPSKPCKYDIKVVTWAHPLPFGLTLEVTDLFDIEENKNHTLRETTIEMVGANGAIYSMPDRLLYKIPEVLSLLNRLKTIA
jgi:hypothetical protein